MGLRAWLWGWWRWLMLEEETMVEPRDSQEPKMPFPEDHVPDEAGQPKTPEAGWNPPPPQPPTTGGSGGGKKPRKA